MAHRFFNCKTLDTFTSSLASGSILENDIVFIEGTSQIWTHNKYYSCPYTKEELDSLVTKNKVESVLTGLITSHTHKYAGSSSAGGSATKAISDSAGQQINTTYIKGLSVSGKVITYTKGDGSTGTITTQDTNTTYSAGTGISLSGTTINNSGVRSVTAGSSANQIKVNTNGTESTITVNNVAASTKATQDGDGKVISSTYAKLSGATFTGDLVVNAPHRDTYYASNLCRHFSANTPNQFVIKTKIKYLSGTHMPVIRIYGYAYGLQSPIELRVGFYIYDNKLGWSGVSCTGAWNPEVYLFSYTESSTKYVAVGFKGSCYFCGFQVDAQIGAAGRFGNDFSIDGWSTTNNGTDTSVSLIPNVGTNDCILVEYKSMKTSISGNASTATKATQDSAGQQINTTYIKGLSVSGKTITYTKGDGTTGTITTQDTNTTYSASNGISLSGTTFSNSGVRSIATGGTNGTISVNTNGTSAEVAVKGLGSAAYTASSSYAAASHNHSASNITSGTLAVERGGTGKTSGADAANYFMNSLSTGESTPSDADYFISQYAGGGTTTTTYHRRPVSALWSYIKSKTDSLYTYSAGNGISLSGNKFSNSGVRSVAAGSSANQIKVNTNGTETTITVNNVASATAATKATQDSAGQQINTTYIKGLSVSGKTITYTKGDGTTGTITTQDTNTTYTAGAGLSLSSNKFSNSAPVYFVSGTQTAATNVWTGSLPTGVTDYSNGLTINYYLPYAGTSTEATLNLGGKGAKKVYRGNASSGVTTHFPAGSVIQLVYLTSLNSNAGGWKCIAYYDSNSTYGIATNTTNGLIKPWYSHTADSTGPTTGNNATAVAVNAITTTSGRYYALETDKSGRGFVNVPWSNTTYSANNGISLSGTTFSNSGVRSIAAGSSANQLSVNTGGTTSTITINNVANATASTTATKLATARSIDGVSFNGTANIVHYGTCSTAVGTAAKTVALTGFSLVAGSRVMVKFTNGNSAASMTLNVNSTGAKSISRYGSVITDARKLKFAAGETAEFVYDGTNYEILSMNELSDWSYI